MPKPSELQLPLHVGDVVAGPLRRRHAVRHRRVLGRQTERVPAHRLQHVAALHAHEARQHVADGVVAHVPHVQAPARVREHATGSSTSAATGPRSPQRCRARPSRPGPAARRRPVRIVPAWSADRADWGETGSPRIPERAGRAGPGRLRPSRSGRRRRRRSRALDRAIGQQVVQVRDGLAHREHPVEAAQRPAEHHRQQFERGARRGRPRAARRAAARWCARRSSMRRCRPRKGRPCDGSTSGVRRALLQPRQRREELPERVRLGPARQHAHVRRDRRQHLVTADQHPVARVVQAQVAPAVPAGLDHARAPRPPASNSLPSCGATASVGTPSNQESCAGPGGLAGAPVRHCMPVQAS